MHQENLAVDAVTDRCIVAGFETEGIAEILEAVFGSANFTKATVEARIAKIEGYKATLRHLLTLPVLEQRTPEWHAARQTLITASDFAQALGDGKFGTTEQLLRKKCGYEEDRFNAAAPALKWGTMLEPVANAIYAQRNKMLVHEFGLLRHPTIPHFGASPDGVNECGIMVEIKCPFRRKIDGTVPLQYFYQIQGQLEVTGLEECDYFECEFASSDRADDEDIFPGLAAAATETCAIIEHPPDNYIYSPTHRDWTPETLAHWVAENTPAEPQGGQSPTTTFCRLQKASTIRVYKDQQFIDTKLGLLSNVWDRIMEYRADEDLYKREVKAAASAADLASKPAPKFIGWAFD